jgi:GT2 family glycosyltransferase
VSPTPAADARTTVVVITHNRRAEVIRSLEHMLELPERPRIVVVDNGSADGTADEIRRRYEVEVIRLPCNRGAAARNVGASRATTRYVAFSDDDTWWVAGALARAADVLDRHPRLALVTGRVLVGTEAREDPTCAVMARSPLPPVPGLPGTPVLGFLAGASVARRSAFLGIGGFEPRLFLGGEEQLVAVDLVAAGWVLAYVADVEARHLPSPQRDRRRRSVLLLRNALWLAWLRRPAATALALTARLSWQARRDPLARRALGEALGGLGWALARRRVLPPPVEAALRRVEAGQLA